MGKMHFKERSSVGVILSGGSLYGSQAPCAEGRNKLLKLEALALKHHVNSQSPRLWLCSTCHVRCCPCFIHVLLHGAVCTGSS